MYYLSFPSRCIHCFLMYSRDNMWSIGSRVTVKSDYDVVLVDTLLNAFTTRSIRLDCHTFCVELGVGSWYISASSSWKYKDSFEKNWMTPFFNDDAWEESQHDGFPDIASATITRYYRYSFRPGNETSLFSGLRMMVNLQYALVLYVNGEELFRHNLHSFPLLMCVTYRGKITPYTPANSFEEEAILQSS